MSALLRQTQLFGSRTRTAVLLLLAMLEESYPTELARLLGAKLYTIQTIINALESETIIVSRPLGRTRRLTLNPRYLAATELKALLTKLSDTDIELQKVAASKRSRPRRPGKPG